MGGGQPYLYTAPARFNKYDPYNNFNPKAVSQASFQANRYQQRPKQQGPLINFNVHPDSYVIATQTKPDYTPMHPKTAQRVFRMKRFQLGMRIIQIAVGLGMLVLVICLQHMSDTIAWVMRAVPAIEVLSGIYAIYHLVRKEKDKTPWNSATYHAFVSILDAAFIPVLVFIGMLSKSNYKMTLSDPERWTSFFSNGDTTTELINAVYFVSIVCTGLHSISFITGLYLLIMFRRISNLPPDMNPLEERREILTRRKNKHKYKNSDATLVASEKHLSASTLASTESTNKQPLSFFHSRDQDFAFPAKENAPNTPKKNVPITRSQSPLAEASRASLLQRLGDQKPEYQFAVRTSPMPAVPCSPKRSIAGSAVSSLHSPSIIPSEASSISAIAHDISYQSQNHQVSPKPRLRSHLGEITETVNNTTYENGQNSYLDTLSKLSPTKNKPSHDFNNQNPLRMNPPTPPPHPIAARSATNPISSLNNSQIDKYNHHDLEESSQTHRMPFSGESNVSGVSDNRTRTMLSNMSAATSASNYSNDSEYLTAGNNTTYKTVGAPKGRFYGDLNSAMRGVKQSVVVSDSDDRTNSMAGSVHGSNWMNRNNISSRSKADESELESEYNSYGQHHNSNEKYGRVISRSGAEFRQTGDFGIMRMIRDVSGKVVEEGRGGIQESSWFGGGLFRRASRKY